MNFYTNITQWGNFLLLREVVNGERINRRVKYSPTLFMPVMKPTEWKTLEGKYVTPIKHQTIKEAKEWIENYKDQPHMVYGNNLFSYNFLSEQFPKRVEWDIDNILIVTIDIEVACENGFPSPAQAIEPLLSNTVKKHQTKKFVDWGIGKFKNNRDDVAYYECRDEEHLIQEFLY